MISACQKWNPHEATSHLLIWWNHVFTICYVICWTNWWLVNFLDFITSVFQFNESAIKILLQKSFWYNDWSFTICRNDKIISKSENQTVSQNPFSIDNLAILKLWKIQIIFSSKKKVCAENFRYFSNVPSSKKRICTKKSKKDSNGKVAEKLPISKARKWSNFCALFPK